MTRLAERLMKGTAIATLCVMLPFAAYANDVVCSTSASACAQKVDLPAQKEARNSENPSADTPVSISVDGVTVFGHEQPEDAARKTDLALEDVDIQVKFDGLGVKPILNVSTAPIRRSYVAGEKIEFLASSNYPAWIASSEIRIFDREKGLRGEPAYRVNVSPEGYASWTMPADGPKDYVYVLRVNDAKGHFDETKPLELQRTAEKMPQHEPQDASVAPGYMDDRTAFRNIPVYGGAITVAGSNVPDGNQVVVLGEGVPVDPDHRFVVQRILPPGDHRVDVAVVNKNGKDRGKGLEFNREINIPDNEWFFVGLADVTAGKRFGSKHIEDVKPGDYKDVYTRGRLAFYLKGKIKGEYLLTAAADSGVDGRLKDIFNGWDKKDVRQLMRRIQPEEYYPVYGDDSTYLEDAPTRGKFYVRLEKGESHVMWGNFKTNITGTQFLRNERLLYGAHGVYKSERTTSDGEHNTKLDVYAAQPGTVSHRDYLLGTGGSAYFLKHQDLTIGSEIVKIEVRDSVGHVIKRTSLRQGFDYEVDYVQGLIQLKSPLSSTVSDHEVVKDSALGGYRQYLTVNYEYLPRASDAHGYVFGGRGEQWLGEHVRVGVTGSSDKTGPADQKLIGTDILLKKSDETFIAAEIAKSRGPGFGHSVSDDGGLLIDNVDSVGQRGKSAKAYRAEGRIGLGEITDNKLDGHVRGYFEKKEGGFSSLDEEVTHGRRTYGVESELKFGPRRKAHVKYEDLHVSDGKRIRELNADMLYGIGEHIEIIPGVKHTLRRDAYGQDRDTGKRTDAGLIAKYIWSPGTSAYVSGQATVDRSGTRRRNDRVGIGGEVPITEKLNASGEVSEGTTGVGAKAMLDYHPTADDHYYFGYKIEPNYEYASDITSGLDRHDYGSFVLGAKRRFSEEVSAFMEENYDPFGDHRSLTQLYGVDYTPSAEWKVRGALEVGHVTDNILDTVNDYEYRDFKRRAASLSAEYHKDDVEAHVKGEARFERGNGHERDRDSYLLGAGFGMKTDENWRFSTKLDAVLSHRNHDVYDGKFIEASTGFAYRPVDDDRLNALFRYTLFYDRPGPDQVRWDDFRHGDRQLNNILSADVSYDVNKWVTVGAKYGFRIGKQQRYDGDGPWRNFSAQLGIIRTDLHVMSKWDLMLEGRVMNDLKNNSTRLGALAAVYREMGENFRVGVGYNFGHFSDDLRDLRHDNQGIFINAIGKF